MTIKRAVCAVVGSGPKNGASFARRFSREGYKVALLSRRTELSRRLASELGDARAYACDVTDGGAVEGAFAQVRQELGEVEVLIYNAGSGVWGNLDEIDAAGFEQSWRVNALGLFLAAKQVVEPMRAAGRGSIIAVGATASLRGKPFTTAFAAAKAAQRSLAQSLARQLGPQGIHVALLIIDGGIGDAAELAGSSEPALLNPDDIADTAYHLTQQSRSAWSFEVDLRPYIESW